MTLFIAFLIFYWVFAWLFCVAALFDESNDEFDNFVTFFLSVFCGGFILPILLGLKLFDD